MDENLFVNSLMRLYTPELSLEDDSEDEDPPKAPKAPPKDDPEDPPVGEIDVFFSPSIDAETQLYAFQYPLRSSRQPYELDDRCEEVRLKPSSSEVEIDLSIDPESNNIDKEFANKYKITKQTFSTTWKPPPANDYAVGLLVGDKLHLHPVDAVVQLRPSLKHLNSGGSKEKNKSVGTSKKKNKQTTPSIEQNSDDEECWVPLKYHSSKSDISSSYLQRMVVQEGPPKDFSAYLLSLPVEKRLKRMLIAGGPLHRFEAIKNLAPEYSERKLLDFLQKYARLLWGHWTAKSILLYPHHPVGHPRGVRALARDYAMVLFSKNLKVQQLQLYDVTMSDRARNHVQRFFNIFGLEGHDQIESTGELIPHWNFRELPDESFIQLYPDIVEQQEEFFKATEKRIRDFLTVVHHSNYVSDV